MTKGVIVQFISFDVKKLELYCLICQYRYTSSINLSFIIVLVNHEPTSQTTRYKNNVQKE